MYNPKIYQICHDLIVYFATLTSPKKVLGLILRTGDSNAYLFLSIKSIIINISNIEKIAITLTFN